MTTETYFSDNIKFRDEEIKSLLGLFFQVFLAQLKRDARMNSFADPKSVSYRVNHVETQKNGFEDIYELTVYWRQKNRDLTWSRKSEKRRITIGLIGHGSSSKSRCFKIIYDHFIVAKIPPDSITNFSDYVRSLQFEQHVTKKLSGYIDYLVPSVSAIFKLFMNPNAKDFPKTEMEWIELLNRKPWLQNYLKIKGKFVYFMDMSRYSFFSDVVKNMHEIRSDQIIGELTDTFNILTNIEQFEGKFGSGHMDLFFGLNQMIKDYYKLLKPTDYSDKAGGVSGIYETHRLLCEFLLNRKQFTRIHGYRKHFVKGLNHLVYTYRRTLGHFKKVLMAHLVLNQFRHHRQTMNNVIDCILDLLTMLETRGVAIRDLKPDNIFLIHQSQPKPDTDSPLKNFLDPCQFPEDNGFRYHSAGLIDFETAVLLTESSGHTQQPLAGGTFVYATPSHFFSNASIKRFLPVDLDTVFHLQDWHAVVGMIYYVITGQDLFKSSGQLMCKLIALKRILLAKNQLPPDYFRICSAKFWQTADNEFQKKMIEKKTFLEQIRIVFSPQTAALLIRHIRRFGQHEMEIESFGYSKEQIIELLKDNIRKSSSESPGKGIAVYFLLHILFHVITQAMCPGRWRGSQHSIEEHLQQVDYDPDTYGSTMLYDDTIIME